MSAERAWKLVHEKKDRKCDVAACARFAAALPCGGGSLADLDDALWLAEAIDAAVAEALPRWVPVGERLPAADDYVLVTYRHGLSGTLTVCEAAFRGQWGVEDPPTWDSHGWPIQDVVAWQPLPASWVAP